MRRRISRINQKITVLFGNFGSVNPQIGATSLFNEFPGFQPLRIFKCRPCRFLIVGLSLHPVVFLLVYQLQRLRRIFGFRSQRQRRDHPIVRKQAAAV